jgi:hypothetical protein
MNLPSASSTRMVNVCGLVVAAIVAMEGFYVAHVRYGIFRPFDVWGPFVPVAVMFIVGNRKFSYFFLFLYAVVLFVMSYQVRFFYLGLYKPTRFETDPLAPVALFLAVSICSLVLYGVAVLIQLVSARSRSGK